MAGNGKPPISGATRRFRRFGSRVRLLFGSSIGAVTSSHPIMAARRPRKSATPRNRNAMPATVSKAAKSKRGRTPAATTPFLIRTQGVELDDATRAFARQRAGERLGKFARHVERITLHLDDVSGPKGAKVIACRVIIRTPRLEPLVVDSENATAREAISRTIDRAERSLRRAIERVETGRTRR
jgi:ribosome-associated translation inhibitor RaiA